MRESKTCRVCGETKPFDDFQRRTDSPDGRRTECIDCRRRQQADYRVRQGGLLAGTKIDFECEDCRQTFSQEIVRGGPRRHFCDECVRLRGIAATLKWHRETGQSFQRHGTTEDQYNIQLAAQGGRCAVCGTDEPGGKGRFHIDHDHECCPGRRSCGACIRGVLCHCCNLGLGYLKDDPAVLEAAIAYLRAGVTA